MDESSLHVCNPLANANDDLYDDTEPGVHEQSVSIHVTAGVLERNVNRKRSADSEPVTDSNTLVVCSALGDADSECHSVGDS